jgi:hypothetical protein
LDYWHDWPAMLIGAAAVIGLEILGFGLLRLLWQSKIEFVFYFADEAQAQPVVAYLKQKGFKVESTLSGDEQQWLVLAAKAVGAFELDRLEAEFESLAKAHGGEYDGFDRAV